MVCDWQFILPMALEGSVSPMVRTTVYKLAELVQWISQKEIDMASIPSAKQNAAELVCMFETVFPTTMLTIQVHLLVHVVDEVEIAGTVHSRWMFFLERFMKTLKGYVRQKARPEGSMAEGWLVSESLVYIAEWLSGAGRAGDALWRTIDDERISGIVMVGPGVEKSMTEDLEAKINRFCMLHSPVMEKWITAYEVAKEDRLRARLEWRRGTRHLHRYPEGLEPLPTFMSLRWLHRALEDAKQQGEQVTEEEWEYSRGCSTKVCFKATSSKVFSMPVS